MLWSLFGLILNCRANYFLFPLTILLFFLSNKTYIMIIYMFGQYDELRSKYLESFSSFILVFGLMVFIFLISVGIRTLLLNYCIQLSLKKMFKQMLVRLMKGSLKYYKGKTSGEVLDKFSV